MPYPAELVQANNESRARLHALLARMTDADYAIPLDADWNVGTALAHVAVYDFRVIEILNRWESVGVAFSDIDVEVFNPTVLPFFRELSPPAIKKLTLEAADACDAKLENLSDAIFDQYATTGGSAFALSRANHRNEHIDQIQAVL